MKKHHISFKDAWKKVTANQIWTLVIALVLAVATFVTSYSQIFYSLDNMFTTYLFQFNPLEKADDRITLIAIDNDTIEEYGDYDDWSRSILAQAVDTLSDNDAYIIGLDVDLSEDKDSAGDEALVTSCENAGDSTVIAMATAIYTQADAGQPMENGDAAITPNDADAGVTTGTTDTTGTNTASDATSANTTTGTTAGTGTTATADPTVTGADESAPAPTDGAPQFETINAAAAGQDFSQQVSDITFPYTALKNVVSIGVSNAVSSDVNGNIRNAALSIQYKDGSYDSFAVSLYRAYMATQGEDEVLPTLDAQSQFGFSTISNVSSYQVISFADLLSGDYDASYLKDHIVIIGEFDASDSSSNYFQYVNSDISKQELLVEAAILHALLNDEIIVDANVYLQAFLYALVIFFFYVFLAKRKTLWAILTHTVAIVVGMSLAYVSNSQGYRFLLLVPIFFAILSFVVQLAQRLVFANHAQRKMRNTLNMYVDSQVVDQITEAAPSKLTSLSGKRNVAILFVDIRGFTAMSEKLEPEQVVEILNRYFTVVYSAITAWNGTLDKFIGDAAMAIFNAPNDLEDYEFKAVCAADDIMKGFAEVQQFYREKYDGEINIGIGIQCGDAIVGNIGCLGRMDYTAIGDTVNTASRIESKAGPGQILLSSEMITQLTASHLGQYKAASIGELTLKGKKQPVPAYELVSIDKPEAPNQKARKEFLHEATLLYSKIKRN